MGWKIVESHYRDLVTKMDHWWFVLDERNRLVGERVLGFAGVGDAMRYAEDGISARFHAWGRDHARTRWERFSLPGGDEYRELLIRVPKWPSSYQPRHFDIPNVLVHVRSTSRTLPSGMKILYLDEIQSDWQADAHAGTAKPAPFRKEWPLLALKVMLWWAQRYGLNGISWSTPEMQQQRWSGHRPPEALYRKVLPDAAAALVKALDLELSQVELPVIQRERWIYAAADGWRVYGLNGSALRPVFRTQADAQAFADQEAKTKAVTEPTILLGDMASIVQIPLWGAGSRDDWCASQHMSHFEGLE